MLQRFYPDNEADSAYKIDYDGLYKKVEVYEWRVSRKGVKAVAEMARKTATEMLAFAEAVKSLC